MASEISFAGTFVLFMMAFFIGSQCQRKFITINTRLGKLRGTEEKILGKYVRSYLGVPFAEPPLGDLRFRPPKPKKPWNRTRLANTLSPACYQEKDGTFDSFWGSDMWNANTPLSEDCLYMNIWAPKTTLTKVPVMVWLFGGGFWYGSPSLALYDGRVLAVTGHVVVVNANYRVGPFGFLFLDHEEIPGNMGMLDQQLALQWIQENIKFFGGDREKVSIFGESAGAASIVAHMIAPESQNLFHNGIMESGSLDNPWAMDTPQKALRKSMAFVKSTKCGHYSSVQKTASCLRQMSAHQLSKSIFNVPVGFLEFYLVIVSKDVNFFREKDAFQSLREGNYRPVDLIIGINKDEGNFWNIYYLPDHYQFTSLWRGPPHITSSQFDVCINKAFSNLPFLVKKAAAYQYWDRQCENKPDFYAEQANQMVGDYFFTCDSLWLADQLVSKPNASRVYIYYFEHTSSTNPWPKWMGAMHGYEIEFVFGVPLLNGTQGGYTGEEIELSRTVIEYWSSFAKDGYPKSRVGWPLYGRHTKLWLSMKAGRYGNKKAIKGEECTLWRKARDMEYDAYMSGAGSKNWKWNVMIHILIAASLTTSHYLDVHYGIMNTVSIYK